MINKHERRVWALYFDVNVPVIWIQEVVVSAEELTCILEAWIMTHKEHA